MAAFLIENMQEERAVVDTLATRLSSATERYLQQRRYTFEHIAHRYGQAANHFVGNQHKQLQQTAHRLQLCAERQLQQAEFMLKQLPERLHTALSHRFLHETNHLNRIDTALRFAGPERILRMGYSLTFDAEGKVVRSFEQISQGSQLLTQLADGEVVSEVLYSSK